MCYTKRDLFTRPTIRGTDLQIPIYRTDSIKKKAFIAQVSNLGMKLMLKFVNYRPKIVSKRLLEMHPKNSPKCSFLEEQQYKDTIYTTMIFSC